MSNDLNQCEFIGRLGRDPEVRYSPSGDAVASFSIACGETWKDKATGEKHEATEWVRCVAWRKLGEICGEYLTKGSQVYVSGKMKTRKWQDKEGQERYTTEIIVDRLQMLGGGSESRREPSGGSQPAGKPNEQKAGGKFDDMDDDIPF